jgi:sialate O-acetylesterase
MRILLFLAILWCSMTFSGFNAYATLKLPGLVGDNMILQRNVKVPVWGWSTPGEKIQVEFKGKHYTTDAAVDGKWLVKLDQSDAGGPYQMDINGTADHIHIKNILIGDVWLCSGQSNMALDFNYAKLKAIYPSEIASSANDKIRQVLVSRTYSSIPANDCKTSGWKSAGPGTLGNFTAAGYFFARNLFEKYHIPIGLINSSYGGTVAESWTSEGGLKSLPQFNDNIQFLKDTLALNEKVRSSKKAFEDWDKNIRQNDKGFEDGHKALWAAENFDDSQWQTMQEPQYWDKQGYASTYGTFWFRKEVNVPEGQSGNPAILQLGQLDDADITYVNGLQIGASENRDVYRQYKIPGSILKPGKNVIAIRIVNINGFGGMMPADTLLLKIGSWSVPLNGDWKYHQGVISGAKPNIYDAKNLPTALYNAMIAPLIPYAIKGVIWYQGEYNAHKAYEYRKLFPALISNWRANWQQGDFPFIYQQLPNFQPVINHPAENEWAELREAQLMALSLPKTAMSVAIDLGGLDLHPVNKKDVGYRLSVAARKLVYNEKRLDGWGPVYQSMKIEGNKIVLTFENGGSKLVSKDGGDLTYFAIAGEDKKFVWAKAVINGNTVEVSSPEISKPVAVRYAWAGNPEGCNLYNADGMPASPFRTDDWPGLTIANK